MISKKELKAHINQNGGYLPMSMKVEKNFSKTAKDALVERYGQEQADKLVEAGTYVKGISSNGELNRNGYIIRQNAWKPAIEAYLENPVFLLGHDLNKVIGETLTAKVGKDGLVTEAILYTDQMDQESALAFERGQLKCLSTGHITRQVEFEHEQTGEIKTEEEFWDMPWEERFSDFWIMAVTVLEWVEQSLVAVPSNRKSMITKKDAIANYMTNKLGLDPIEVQKQMAGPSDEELEQIEEENESLDTEQESTQEAIEEAAQESAEENQTENTEAGDVTPATETNEGDEQVETPEDPGEKPEETSESGETPEEENGVGEATGGETPEENHIEARPISREARNRLERAAHQINLALQHSFVKDEGDEGEAPVEENATTTQAEAVTEPEKNETKGVSIDFNAMTSIEELCVQLDANGLQVVSELITKLAAHAKSAQTEANNLRSILEKTPKYRGVRVANQMGEIDLSKATKGDSPVTTNNNKPKPGSALTQIFERSGLGDVLKR